MRTGTKLPITTAMRECATNTVRHAGGNEMKVRIFEVKSTLVVWIENNGKPPERKVVEGGGLSDLRKRIEKAGGTMRIKSSPTYRLTVILPGKEK